MMAFTNNVLEIRFFKMTLYSFIESRFRSFRPWFYNDFLFSLSPQGRKQKKILKILHGFTENVRNKT